MSIESAEALATRHSYHTAHCISVSDRSECHCNYEGRVEVLTVAVEADRRAIRAEALQNAADVLLAEGRALEANATKYRKLDDDEAADDDANAALLLGRMHSRILALAEPGEDCTCKPPARDCHDRECPVRKRHPRVDKGDVDTLLLRIAYEAGFGLTPESPELYAMRRAYVAGRRGDTQ